MYKFIFILLILSAISWQSFGQDEVFDSTGTIEYDDGIVYSEAPVIVDTNIYLRSFDINSDSVVFLRNKKQYSYVKNLDSLLKEAQKRNDRSSTVPQRSGSGSIGNIFDSTIVQAILWILAAGFVGFIIYRLFLTKGLFEKSGRKSKVEEALTADEEFLKDNFNNLYLRAKADGDLRSATRYLFLHTLKQLETRSEIEFSLDKTNSRYITELAPHKRESFSWLVMNYEYIWYGKTAPQAERFSLIESRFNEFNRL